MIRIDVYLSEVTKTMATEKYGSAVVINNDGAVLGIFTTIDALNILTKLLKKDERIIEEWFEWDSLKFDNSMGE